MAKLVKQNMNALKRERQDKKKKAMNKFYEHTMKTYIRKAREAKTAGTGIDTAFLTAQKWIAKNVKKHVIHKNRGARLTSRLHATVYN